MDFQVKRKPIIPVKPEVESITITLDIKEAMFLQAVLGKISGYDNGGPGLRSFTSDLWNKLYNETKELYPYDNLITGSLYIE